MKKYFASIFFAFTLTLQSSLVSISISPEQMLQYQIGKAMGFATSKVPVEVYFFTNWSSDSCRKLDPSLEAMMPELLKHARIFFISSITDQMKPLNEANMAALLDNTKTPSNYFKFRSALFSLAAKSANPTTEEIQQALKSAGIQYTPPQTEKQKESINVGLQNCSSLIRDFKASESPAVFVINLKTHTIKSLAGPAAITQANIVAVIEELKAEQLRKEEERKKLLEEENKEEELNKGTEGKA